MVLNKIYLGDCIEIMKDFPDNCIDSIVTDPPFNISGIGKDIQRKSLSSKMYKRNSNIKKNFGDWDIMEEKKYYDFTRKWFKECARILKSKGWIFIFFSKDRTGYFADPLRGLFFVNNFKTKTIISWHKTNPVPSFRKMNFLSSCEFCVVGSKGESRIPNFLMQKEMHNFFETPNSSSYGKTKHPTEKPEKLVEWLIKIGSKENMIILDPFLGSGTTAIACIKLNRKFIGIEKEKEYFNIAEKRIFHYKRDLRLF